MVLEHACAKCFPVEKLGKHQCFASKHYQSKAVFMTSFLHYDVNGVIIHCLTFLFSV